MQLPADKGDPVQADGDHAAHKLGCDSRWSVWRDVVVRGTGFSVSLLDDFAAQPLGLAADRLLAAEAAAAELAAQARKLCYARLQLATPLTRARWRAAMRALKSGRVPEPESGDETFDSLMAQFGAALAKSEALLSDYLACHAEGDSANAMRLTALAQDSRFREAITWQNRHAVRSGLDVLLRHTADTVRNSQRRKHELLVARYLQRYAAKNDTIGFFGPVAWAVVRPASGISVHHGTALATDAKVNFEPWAVQTMIAAIAQDPGMRGAMSPHAHPACRLDGTGAVTLLEREFRLPVLEQAVFGLCDGKHTVAQIHAASLGVATETDIAQALERLVMRGLVSPHLRIAVANDSMQSLQLALAQLAPSSARDRWRTGIDQLLDLRLRAQQAMGSAEVVNLLLEQLDQCFTDLCGVAPTHLAGGSYAGRTLVSLDTRRGTDIVIPDSLVKELAEPMRPVLDAAYWFSCQAHAQLTEFAGGIFDEHSRDGCMPLDNLWFRLQQQELTVNAIVDDVVEQLIERWDTFAESVTASVTAAELAQRSDAAFSDVAAGWPGARFQAPDVMLAARDLQAINEGDCQFVLGELHAADRSLFRQVFLEQHVDPARLHAAVARDQTEPELRPLLRSAALLARTRTLPDAPYAFDIECDAVSSTLPASRVLRSGDLWVERRPHGLSIRTRDARLEFPLHAFLGPQAATLIGSRFSLFAPVPYRARSTIGRLVVGRASWSLDLAPMQVHRATTPESRFRAVRRQALDLGWPRRVFYRVPGELKPLYLDMDSPCFVELFARTVRLAAQRGEATLQVVQMLPLPADSWLTDATGARYTSEWRMLFVRR